MVCMEKQSIDLFGGITSMGVPFPRENKEHIGYMDIIKKELEDQDYSVRTYNMSNLDKGHTWDLKRIFMQNYTLAQIKDIQINSINKLKNTNLLFKLIIPSGISSKYPVEDGDSDITIADVYRNSGHPKFVYSAGPNDFFSFIKAGPIEVMSKEVRKSLPDDLEGLVIKSIDNIEDNLRMLIDLNNNVEIFVLGFYYSPLFDKIQKIIYLQKKMEDKNAEYANRFLELISLFNTELEKRCGKYPNVKFINIEFIKDACAPRDFHPNTLGNQLIAGAVLKEMTLDEAKIAIDENTDVSYKTHSCE